MKRKEKQEFKYKGSITLRKGLKLWEFDTNTGILKEVEMMREVAIGLDKKAKMRAKAQHNPNAIYHQSYNRRTAIGKYNKIFDAMNYYLRLVQTKKVKIIYKFKQYE